MLARCHIEVCLSAFLNYTLHYLTKHLPALGNEEGLFHLPSQPGGPSTLDRRKYKVTHSTRRS